MFRRLRRAYSPPRRPRRYFYGGGRYRPWNSMFSFRNMENYYRYRNTRRPRPRRRPRHINRDRAFYNSSVTEAIPVAEEPEEAPPPTEEILKIIHVEDVDFHIAENTQAHHTNKFDKTEDRVNDDGKEENGELVVRRGQEFSLTLNMDRPYNKEKDDLRLVFRIGENPNPTKGTEVTIKVNESGVVQDNTEWRSAIKSITGNDVTLSVLPAVNCIIGEWDFAVQTVLAPAGSNPEKIYEYDEPDNIYILLNPWCQDDTVYMNEELLEEYVLNDQGCQWYGSDRSPQARNWFFAQFEDEILDTSLHLLRRGNGLEINEKMADPVWICRMLSKMVNSSDDDGGVLTGNWSGNYSGGARPLSWTGSKKILKLYTDSKKAVKFGQCWVFSGVLTTVCRAIGLPTRSVTNFDSAHDSNENAVIDKYYDENGDKISGTGDSIWNYHVWNEVWMTRPDLPQHYYNGWQAIDATPQETSAGDYQCGPTPVNAIKNGHLWVKYDSLFVFSEVNSIIKHWRVKKEGGVELMKTLTKGTGTRLITKQPTGYKFKNRYDDRLDCAYEYKPLEGSLEENRMLKEVSRYVKGMENFEPRQEDIVVTVDDRESVLIGSDFVFKCTLHNASSSKTSITVVILAKMSTYTGDEKLLVKSKQYSDETLKSGETKHFELPITIDDYLDKLEGEDSMKILVIGKNLDTGEGFLRNDNFTFDHPPVKVKAIGPFKKGEPFKVKIEMTNPLPIPLTELSLVVEGPGLKDDGKEFELSQNTIPAKGTFTEIVRLVPKRAGTANIYASIDCKELAECKNDVPEEVIVKLY